MGEGHKGAILPRLCILLAIGLLPGCLPLPNFGASDANTVEVSRTASVDASGAPLGPESRPSNLNQDKPSGLIEGLIARQSVIPAGTSYDTVARSVLASSSGVAAAELRAARLRAQAQSKNWLPSIGPVISLNSLGAIVASLFVEQVIFDNGRKKAERDFAAADVEVAAVSLSRDSNKRVYDGLSLYVASERALKEARVANEARQQMSTFVDIIRQRVEGGVSNLADLRVAEAKIREIDAELIRAQEVASVAQAELETMSGLPFGQLSGLATLSEIPAGYAALSIVESYAIRDRLLAQAKIERAGILPSVKATGVAGDNANISLDVSTDSLINLGTGANLEAIEAAKQAAEGQIKQTREDVERDLHRLKQRKLVLARQKSEARALAREGQNTFQLFFEQFRDSGRPIMDVVNVFQDAVRLERETVRIDYEAAQVELDIANLYGALVNGNDV